MNETTNQSHPMNALLQARDIFSHAADMGFGDIHFKHDAATGLRAIIAIHSTKLGPALGGCRCVPYSSADAALNDVMDLAQAMSYKAAMAGLPLGGGKAVIIKPKQIKDRTALFEAYGNFVNELGGRYISSVDSGTGTKDMDIAARKTQFVRSTSDKGDPSPSTAFGVRRGIEAAVKHKLNRDNLENIHIAIQGVGHVGYHLAKELYQLGAKLTVCDINKTLLARCTEEFGAAIVSPDKIHTIEADVLAPCALGGVINEFSIKELNTQIIAGATNNILADAELADELHAEGILYAPDYVINAGGLMQVWIEDETALQNKVSNIYDTLLNLFQRSDEQNQSPAIVVNNIAEEIIYSSKTK
ncbi:Leu/Phe/Val dehydrogenase [Pseudomonadota bacterium]